MTEEDGTGDGGLTWKRRVRAAHRGSVTRLTDKLDEILISGDARRLRQLKQSLTDKQHVLSKLDEELIELVNDEHLEEEVEAADLIRERIGLAIISLDDALESLSTRRTPREASSPSRSPLASVKERRLHHDEPSDVRVSSIHHGLPTSSTVDLRPATTDATTSPWTASSGVPLLPPMPRYVYDFAHWCRAIHDRDIQQSVPTHFNAAWIKPTDLCVWFVPWSHPVTHPATLYLIFGATSSFDSPWSHNCRSRGLMET